MQNHKVSTMGIEASNTDAVESKHHQKQINRHRIKKINPNRKINCISPHIVCEQELKTEAPTRNTSNFNKLQINLSVVANYATDNISSMRHNASTVPNNIRKIVSKNSKVATLAIGKNHEDAHNKLLSSLIKDAEREPSIWPSLDAIKRIQCNNQLGNKTHLNGFNELKNFLKLMFLYRLTNENDIVVSIDEIMILTALLKKKFGVDLPVSNVYLVDTLLDENFIKIKKRPEECYKFVFKHSFKNMKRMYCDAQFDEQMLNHQLTEIEDFYQYYFGDISAELGVPISHFYLPLTPDSYCNKNKQSVSKTINMGYMNLISKSGRFMKEFENYLNDQFISNYSKLIEIKIDHMAEKWNEIYLCMNQNERCLFFICDYIKTNKKCKLPWTVREVTVAIDTVRRMMEKSKEQV